jgi:hypothetical protein
MGRVFWPVEGMVEVTENLEQLGLGERAEQSMLLL